MKRKISCSDYGFMRKNLENDSRTPFTTNLTNCLVDQKLQT